LFAEKEAMMTNSPPPLTIDFRDPAYRADPYPQLAQLRQHDPVHLTALGFWLMTRYEDVNRLNRDPRLGRDLGKWQGYALLRPYLAESALEQCVEKWMFSLDPPEHTRLRKLFAAAFTPKIVKAMATEITAVADELLAKIASPSQPFDFMSSFAQPLPVRIIAKLLGLPLTDYEQLKTWSDKMVTIVEPVVSRAKREIASTAVTEMSHYLQETLADQPPEPESFLGQLLTATATEQMSQEELIANLILLFIAGHETTTNLLGNGLLALLRHPDQLQRLRDEPDLMETAVEELLRYDGPANVNGRAVHEDIEVGGKTIAKGSLVLCMLGAANRDPQVFNNPNDLDIGRKPNPHVTFGGGIHYCLGAPLARLEAQIALDRILHHWPVIALEESGVQWHNFVNLRGLEKLPIHIQGEKNE
jgi:cytochrome P450